MPMEGQRAIPGTRFKSESWKCWPGTESNQRHADFQYGGDPGSARAGRRPGTSFRRADRAYSEREPETPADFGSRPMRLNRLRASRPNFFRTAWRTEPAPGLRSPSPSTMTPGPRARPLLVQSRSTGRSASDPWQTVMSDRFLANDLLLSSCARRSQARARHHGPGSRW